MLEINNISKSFDGLIALNGINMNLKKNKISMIIGPNGSGKTTLLRILSNIYKPDSGSVEVNGRSVNLQTQLQPA